MLTTYEGKDDIRLVHTWSKKPMQIGTYTPTCEFPLSKIRILILKTI